MAHRAAHHRRLQEGQVDARGDRDSAPVGRRSPGLNYTGKTLGDSALRTIRLVMLSVALGRWQTESRAALDEIAAAHRAIGGSRAGRRYATREINHAYVVLLSSQFQRFCRDLHTEATEHVVTRVAPATVRSVLRVRLLEGRKLDKGNPNPSNLGSDFGRFEFDFWAAVRASDRRNGERQRLLSELAEWRNAIAHQDFTTTTLTPPPPLQLLHVRRWRSACEALATYFNAALMAQIASLVGEGA